MEELEQYYQVIKFLGVGGFGKVVEAIYKYGGGEHVAVKILPKKDYKVAQILSEAQILSKMKHPNIVQFKGVRETENKLLIEMALIKQGPLKVRKYIVESREIIIYKMLLQNGQTSNQYFNQKYNFQWSFINNLDRQYIIRSYSQNTKYFIFSSLFNVQYLTYYTNQFFIKCQLDLLLTQQTQGFLQGSQFVCWKNINFTQAFYWLSKIQKTLDFLDFSIEFQLKLCNLNCFLICIPKTSLKYSINKSFSNFFI